MQITSIQHALCGARKSITSQRGLNDSDVENPMVIPLVVLLLETAMSIQTPSPAPSQSGWPLRFHRLRPTRFSPFDDGVTDERWVHIRRLSGGHYGASASTIAVWKRWVSRAV